MKKKELSDLRKKDIVGLTKLVSEKRAELTKAYSEKDAGKQKNLKHTKILKRDIAQILTIVTELELNNQKEVKEKI